MANFQNIVFLISILTYCGFLIWAAIGDIRSFTITNRLNIAFFFGFLVLAFPLGLNIKEIGIHIIIAGIAFIIGFLLFAAGLFGGGDAKLIAATAVWLGPAPMMAYATTTALAGGVLALLLIIARLLAKKFGLPKQPKWLRRMLRKTNHVPYGVALCVGGLLAIPQADWFLAIKLF